MKILFVVSKYYPEGAGSGRSVKNLAESVAGQGHEAVVVRLTKDKHRKDETINGVKIYHSPLHNLYWIDDRPKNPLIRFLWHLKDTRNIAAARDFAKILDAEKPDIVNTNVIAGFSASIFSVVKKRDIKLVHTLRDYYLLCPQSGMFKDGNNCKGICAPCKPFAMARKSAARDIDLFLSNSNFVLEKHRTLGAIHKSHRAMTQFNMNDDDKIADPRTINKKNTIRFGFIGRLDRVKGLEVLLKATQALNLENWSLKIAGTGEKNYVETLKSNHNDPRIQFLGHKNADEFYQGIDILICPSLYDEPLPRVVYEAYRAALPVIASNTGGTPEIVEEGKTGFLYEAKDIAALTALMERLASDPTLYKTMSKHAAEKAALFTKSTITTQFISHMEATLASKNEGGT